MLNTSLDLVLYLAGLMAAGAALFTGLFLAVSAYYFITDQLKGE